MSTVEMSEPFEKTSSAPYVFQNLNDSTTNTIQYTMTTASERKVTNLTRLIACIITYNDDKFILDTLKNLISTIKDLDAIEVFDGAWLHGGATAKSEDSTRLIVRTFAKLNDEIQINFHEFDEIFESESEKRNLALRTIEEEHGEDVVVLVIDADEVFRFYNGLEEIYLKPMLHLDRLGTVDVYAVTSKNKMINPRLIPLGQGIHYHTKRSMIIHSNKCQAEFNYNLDMQSLSYCGTEFACYHLADIFIVNKWVQRGRERMEQKLEFCKHIESQDKNAKCDYS